MWTTRTHFDAKPNYFPNNNASAEDSPGYSIPELPLPVHSFKLDAPEVYLVQSKPPFPTPGYRRVSSVPFPQHSELNQRMTRDGGHFFPGRVFFSHPPNTSHENNNPRGHYDNLDTRDVSPSKVEEYFDQGPLTIQRECYRPFSNQIPELTCVINTYLLNELDINSISNSSRTLLDFMRPFHASIGLTDEIIFGRRLSDVHVLMRERHVSGQQFILKIRMNSDGYHLIIHNHGNQIIKLSGSSCQYVLERGSSYAFNPDDDAWLTINGIEEIVWHIKVTATVNDTKLASVSFQNIYFNPFLYQESLIQQNDCTPPMPIPGESHS